MKSKILIVDDDPVLCSMLVEHLQRKGYEAKSECSLKQGLTEVGTNAWDVVLLDVQMPDGNGLDAIPDFIKSDSRPELIIVTGHGAPDGAEKAILSGAWSYIEKPHVIRDLPLHLTRALQYRQEKQRITSTPVALKRNTIVGNSPAINRCLDDLAGAAVSDVNVLLTGETGTGKEIFARAIHENSNRARHNFVVVDCASLPESLMESALFGHVRGAFTGANKAQDGLIKHADGGTLFLDEVGELPPSMQKTFLRVLQEHSYRPLGESIEISSDFRLVAATHRDIEQMANQGSFRKDLLYRLKGLTMPLPPLRDRKEDISDLVQHCATRLCKRYDLDSKGMAPDFIEGLAAYNWPGNIRELFQTIEQIFSRAVDAPTLFSIHLPQSFRIRMAKAGMQNESNSKSGKQSNVNCNKVMPWRDFKSLIEKDYIEQLIKESKEDIKTACRISGLSRARLYQLFKKYETPISERSTPGIK